MCGEYADISARLRFLDDSGFDQAVCFPNYGLLWERVLGECDVPSLLARSFPNPGDDLKIIEMFKASAADDQLGVPVRLEADSVYYAYPVAILAATRPA